MWGQCLYLLDPGPQVGRALIETGVLNEVALAGRLHLAAVLPVEFVQVGDVVMGFLAGVDRAAGVHLPGAALGGEDTRIKKLHTQHNPNIPSRSLSPFKSSIPQHRVSRETLALGGDPLWRRKVSNTVGSQEGAPARKCSHYNVIHSTLYGAPTFSNPGIFLGTRNHSENLSPDNGFGGKTNRKTKARSE